MMETLAIAIIVGQVVLGGLLIWFVRTFGAYAKAIIKAHQSNTVVYQQAIKILEYTHGILEKEKKSA